MIDKYYIYGVFMHGYKVKKDVCFHTSKAYSIIEDIIQIPHASPTYLYFDCKGYTYRQYIHLLQGYLDGKGINDFNRLEFPLKVKDFFTKFIDIPFTLCDEFIVVQDCNVFDLLDILYQQPLVFNYTFKQFSEFLQKINCKIRVVDKDAVVPTNNRLSDVGYDLSIIKHHKELNSTTNLYDTGIQVQVPFGYYIEIVPRSSLSKSGYMLSNSLGIIDNNYRGNLYISLTKTDPEAPEIVFPFKCCQIILRRQYFMNIVVQTEGLSDTSRGDGGFGSTNPK